MNPGGIYQRIKALKGWALDSTGSTTGLALLRIGLVGLIWTRWAYSFLLYKRLSIFDFGFALFFFASTAAFFVGYKTRLSGLCTALAVGVIYFYYGHTQGIASWTHHHTYLLTASGILLAFSSCAGRLSVDFYLATDEQRQSLLTTNLWAVRLLAIQIAVMYFWTAFNKTNYAWVSGQRMEHLIMYYYTGSNYALIPAFGVLTTFAANMVLGLEYALAFGLFWKKSRNYLIPMGIGLHLLFYMLLPVSTFSLNVILLYIVFFNFDSIDHWLGQMVGYGRPG